MKIQLINQMVDEFLDFKEVCIGERAYQEFVFRWVAVYHSYDEEFTEALRILQEDRRLCIPDGKLQMTCHYPCFRCHLNLKKDLINRINNPFKLRA